jgi:hypothetical protein
LEKTNDDGGVPAVGIVHAITLPVAEADEMVDSPED